MEFTIGCDPEFPLTKKGVYISAIPLVKGTKKKPEPLENGGFVMRDNVAIEFGVPPAKSKLEFMFRISDALSDLEKCLPEDVQINVIPSAHFHRDELKHPEAREFGCDPDYNAWTGEQNTEATRTAPRNFRSFGGHVHIGSSLFTELPDKQLGVKLCDVFHGIICTTLDNGPAAIARRNLYGKPGCYRPTDYGFEYRTLSNFWCKSPSLVSLIYELSADVVRAKAEKRGYDIIDSIGAESIQKIILEGDADAALDIINGYLVKQMSNKSVTSFSNVWQRKDEMIFKDEWTFR